MTADEMIAAIKEKPLQITPKLSKSGEVIGWVAGHKRLAGDTGIVHQDGFALGRTLEEAITNLLAGKTQFRWDGTGYVGTGN